MREPTKYFINFIILTDESDLPQIASISADGPWTNETINQKTRYVGLSLEFSDHELAERIAKAFNVAQRIRNHINREYMDKKYEQTRVWMQSQETPEFQAYRKAKDAELERLEAKHGDNDDAITQELILWREQHPEPEMFAGERARSRLNAIKTHLKSLQELKAQGESEIVAAGFTVADLDRQITSAEEAKKKLET